MEVTIYVFYKDSTRYVWMLLDCTIDGDCTYNVFVLMNTCAVKAITLLCPFL